MPWAASRICGSLRAAALKVFDDKGHFSLHDDPDSMIVFDAFAWLSELAGGGSLKDAKDACARLERTWFRDGEGGGFGLTGYGPGFVESWWKSREGDDLFERVEGGVRLTSAASEALVRSLRALAEARAQATRG